MSREIKFRAFHKERKIMASVATYHWNGDAHVNWTDLELHEKEKNSNKFYPGSVGADWNKDEFVLMQFTGLKDKNGKEIYEGDVIKWSTESGGLWDVEQTSVVKFEKGCFVALLALREMSYMEVIGNIYQNPDLITAP